MQRSILPTPASLIRVGCAALAAVPALIAGEARADSPGLDAIEQYRLGHDEQQAVENRFFLKENRFEISPVLGYVPNNPFAKRYMFGAVLGYHFAEQLSVQAAVLYSPDLGESDLKGLTHVLIDRAYQAGDDEDGTDFQQPLDKAGLTGTFGVAWAPLYGKINLVGETVLNFDFYLFGGVGMISKQNYFAVYDPATDPNAADNNNVALQARPSNVVFGPNIGIGQNYFLNRMMAFKIDIRAAFYVDKQPQYERDVAPDGLRLYNNVIASAGVGFFFPNMKKRLYDF